MGKRFVGLDGLKHFWIKAKTWITGQITSEVTAKIAEIVANAPEDLDTLKEIADWISAHANDASAMNTQITTNKNDIATLKTSVAGKADKSHTHTKSQITDFAHTHDDRYFTETEVTNKLAGKSDTGHTHTKSQITDFPTSLKNPNALTINGKTYDGSSAVNAGVQTVANGGTGQTTANAAANSFINSLSTGTAVPADNDYYISQYANGGTNTTTYHRRPVSKLWEYIKGKISSVLGLTATNYGGKASTAGTADKATSANKVTNALTVNGKTYDGSSAVNAGVQTIANGGTGATTAKGAEYNIIGGVETVDTDLTDSRYFALRNETISSGNGSFRWNKVSKIKKYTESNYWYGTCSTASSTVAKTVSITDFSLTKNVRVTVKFTNSNTATNATLNINSTGAKPIYYKGTNVGNNIIDTNSTVNLVYNGTQYEIIGDFTPTTTSVVTGVKGEAESSYRDGNVNITKADLGLTTDTLGIKWYDSNITSGGTYYRPYYANGVWVVGSGVSGIKYSTDGKTWTNSNIISGSYGSPYYTNGVWVIGSGDGSGGIMYSTDGKTWTDSNITDGTYYYPYYANGVWVIGSDSGIKYSTDGKTWNSSNISSGRYYNAPYYANGVWVIGSRDNNGIKYSTDGKTWNSSNITSGSYRGTYYANRVWVIGSDSSGIKYSTDGKTWNSSNISSGTYYYPYYANGVWVIGSDSSGIKYSTDGKTWTNSNIISGSYGSPYYTNGVWVIGSRNNNGIKYSTDGKTWNSSNITSGSYRGTYYANGVWVIGGGGIKYSTFNSLNDLGSAFKGITELKSYVDDTGAPTHYCKVTRVNDTTVKVLANFDGVFESHGLLSGGNYSLAFRTTFSAGVEKTITNYDGRSFMNYDPIIFYIQDSNNYNVGGMTVTQTFTKVNIPCLLL